jgi:hypothetical protein
MHDTFFLSDPASATRVPDDYMLKVKEIHEKVLTRALHTASLCTVRTALYDRASPMNHSVRSRCE